RAWIRRIREEAATTLELLESRYDALSEAARAEADEVLAARDAVFHAIEATPTGFGGAKIRIHGDYHLGQVLLARNDFLITDFEGEPARSPNERRAKHSPLRDVAGMLRSFNYAAYAAAMQAAAERPDHFEAFEPLVREWEAEATRVFLAGYAEATREAQALYAAWDAAPPLLRLFQLEKALYELRYELHNRPDWVRIPLRGLRQILAGQA